VVGRPHGYDPASVETLRQVVAARTEAAGIPVLANVERGRTDPMLTLPLGADAEVDAGARTFRLLEPATAER
jgi:muramoyltetrapeptide carboxypeptidase LdcA involved in peptidoglycan recycling